MIVFAHDPRLPGIREPGVLDLEAAVDIVVSPELVSGQMYQPWLRMSNFFRRKILNDDKEVFDAFYADCPEHIKTLKNKPALQKMPPCILSYN